MKVIMQCKEIPLQSFVTKITGTKQYILTDKFIAYGENGKQILLNVSEDVRYLIAKEGTDSINIISTSTELVWHTTEEKLREYLIQLEYQRDSK